MGVGCGQYGTSLVPGTNQECPPLILATTAVSLGMQDILRILGEPVLSDTDTEKGIGLQDSCDAEC
jgi:hypothetical protein